MAIHQRFTIKELHEVQSGEMIAFDMDGRALGIVMDRHPEGYAMQVLVLASRQETSHPHWITLQGIEAVMSLGSDWVLDLIESEAYAGNYDRIDEPGTVVVSKTGVVVRAAGDGTGLRSRPSFFDLVRCAPGNRTPDIVSAVCIRNWKVWINEGERTRVGGEPVFSFRD